MTLKLVQFWMTPKKKIYKIFIPPKNIHFSETPPKKIEIQNFEPQKKGQSLRVCENIREPPPPPGAKTMDQEPLLAG